MDESYDVDARIVAAYNLGVYEVAYVRLRELVEEHPGALGGCFSLLYTCERVLQTLPDEADLVHALRWTPTPYTSLGRFRLRFGTPTKPVRCKWCGHYTKWVAPHEDSLLGNECQRCRSVYPMPAWDWDTPSLMAHSEGRGSWAEGSLPSRLWHEMCHRYERESGDELG